MAHHPIPARRRAIVTGLLALCVLTLGTITASVAPAGASTSITDGGILNTTPNIPALSRDCGLSTKLSDGNFFWLFCDSFYTSNKGVLHAVQYNSAALAGPATPTTMSDDTFNFYGEYILNADVAHPGGRNFITLPDTTFPCTNGVRKAWPRGLTTIPKAGPGGSDRVLIYYAHICDQTKSTGSMAYVNNGIGLAEYDYTPGSFNPATGISAPLVATSILNDNLFPAPAVWGSGAMTSSDGQYVYVYRCDTSCYAGRVPQAQVATAASYQWWDGAAWSATAAAMTMPVDSLPTAQFTVAWLPQQGSYVMVYTPCFTGCQLPAMDQMQVRTSASPQGPWSAPATIMLANCTKDLAVTPCNAAAAHVDLSSTDLFVSYSRRNEGAAPPGRIHWATIPLAALNTFSVGATSATVTAGGATAVTVPTATASGQAQSLAMTVSGLPAGVTATFSPASVASGTNAVLNVSTLSSTVPGTYTINVTATGTGAVSQTTALTLTVDPLLINGSFETGTFTGWTTTGTATVQAGGHAGTHTAQLGAATATNGDSTAVQTFTAPAGMTNLSLWFLQNCQDNVFYDWATVVLRDKTSQTTNIVLGRTCGITGWAQLNAPIVGGHLYLLTLLSHDDGNPGDVTYTRFDDIAMTSPPPPVVNPVANPGFEGGTLTGWTLAGTGSAIAGGHTGSSAGRLGSAAATNGSSTLAQTFTAPTGATSVSLWYSQTCPDTVAYDWAAVTLRDNTTGLTTTLLANTCRSGSWLKVAGSVTAGHSYTLTLLNHDDNYIGDGTFTNFDDVLVELNGVNLYQF